MRTRVLLLLLGLLAPARAAFTAEADRHGLKIPNLRRLLAEWAHATAVSGVIDLRDVAPTLAGLLGLALPTVEGRNLLQHP